MCIGFWWRSLVLKLDHETCSKNRDTKYIEWLTVALKMLYIMHYFQISWARQMDMCESDDNRGYGHCTILNNLGAERRILLWKMLYCFVMCFIMCLIYKQPPPETTVHRA